MERKKLRGQSGRMGPWDMFRDVFVTAIHYGQFSSALLGLIMIVWILSMAPEDLSLIVTAFVVVMTLPFTCCVISTLLAVGWIVHIKIIKASHRSNNRFINPQ